MENGKMNVEEIEKQLISIITNTDFFSLTLDKSRIGRNTSIVKDLALDSIQLLEYLVAIENTLGYNLDYQDLYIEVFDNFGTLAEYFYKKIQLQSGAVEGGKCG